MYYWIERHMSALREKGSFSICTLICNPPLSSALQHPPVFCTNALYIINPLFLLTLVCISMAVLSCVYAQMHFCVSMHRRSCLQVLYEFHLSAAWGTMWRISPNGLVCNCSVNTCLSRLGECRGEKGPSLQRTEATY